MAGFDADAAREAFGIPAGVRPLVVVAVGTLGDYATAPPEIVERDALAARAAAAGGRRVRRQLGVDVHCPGTYVASCLTCGFELVVEAE